MIRSIPKPPSRIPKPKQLEHRGDNVVLEGSLSHSRGLILSERQKKQILDQLRDRPSWPSQIEVTGLSRFDAFHCESVTRFIGALESSGIVELVKDERGRALGWSVKSSEE